MFLTTRNRRGTGELPVAWLVTTQGEQAGENVLLEVVLVDTICLQ